MSTRQYQQRTISKFFIRIILFEFDVTSQVFKHCSIFRHIHQLKKHTEAGKRIKEFYSYYFGRRKSIKMSP